ncbi:futalosine hydrolase [Streptomyces sp. AC563]|uniref:futalosine hydrolase n=1 Tax=Streptomyces buecherae TaxID=2763006 RepID=UPI00164D59AE|nr:futalosine hydrolase [Streptomyces buecherae]MBC3992346.1 futalosine hydrolase [Streptomyces buecherae]
MRALIVTAVPAERDAVVRGIRDAGAFEGVERALPGAPGYARHRLALPVTGASDALTLEALDADVLAAGVGPAASAAATGSALATATADGLPYDLVISAGIGGGFGVAPAIPPARTESAGTGSAGAESAGTGSAGTGSVGAGQAAARPGGLALAAVVVADAIVAADLGAETPDGFAAVTDLGFGTIRHLPPAHLVRAAAEATGGVRGSVLTVSTVTGSAGRAAELMARHPGALAEAMEGFGVAEAATAYGVPVLEIRTVSNAVGPRDRAAWRIDAALAALTAAFDALARALPRAMAENGAPADPAGTARGSSALHEAASDAAAGDGPT